MRRNRDFATILLGNRLYVAVIASLYVFAFAQVIYTEHETNKRQYKPKLPGWRTLTSPSFGPH